LEARIDSGNTGWIGHLLSNGRIFHFPPSKAEEFGLMMCFEEETFEERL
jgi:hypothetical protein